MTVLMTMLYVDRLVTIINDLNLKSESIPNTLEVTLEIHGTSKSDLMETHVRTVILSMQLHTS